MRTFHPAPDCSQCTQQNPTHKTSTLMKPHHGLHARFSTSNKRVVDILQTKPSHPNKRIYIPPVRMNHGTPPTTHQNIWFFGRGRKRRGGGAPSSAVRNKFPTNPHTGGGGIRQHATTHSATAGRAVTLAQLHAWSTKNTLSTAV